MELVRRELQTAVNLCENDSDGESHHYQVEQISQTQLGRLIARIYGKENLTEAIRAKRIEYERLQNQPVITPVMNTKEQRKVVRRNAAVQVRIKSESPRFLDVSDISLEESHGSFDTSYCDSMKDPSEPLAGVSDPKAAGWLKTVPSRFQPTTCEQQAESNGLSGIGSPPLISGCDYLEISDAQQLQQTESQAKGTDTPANQLGFEASLIQPQPVANHSNDTEDTVADEELQYDSDFVAELLPLAPTDNVISRGQLESKEVQTAEDLINVPTEPQPQDFAAQLQIIADLIRSEVRPQQQQSQSPRKVPRIIEIKDEQIQCERELTDKDTQCASMPKLSEASQTVTKSAQLSRVTVANLSFESVIKEEKLDGAAQTDTVEEGQSIKEVPDRIISGATDQQSFAISTDSSTSQSLSSGEISLNRLKDILPKRKYEDFLRNVTFLHFDENCSSTSEGEVPLIKQLPKDTKRPTIHPIDDSQE